MYFVTSTFFKKNITPLKIKSAHLKINSSIFSSTVGQNLHSQVKTSVENNVQVQIKYIQYFQCRVATLHQKINVERILILRALWRKYSSQVLTFNISSLSEEGASIDIEASTITSLSNQPRSQSPSSPHDKNKSLTLSYLGFSEHSEPGGGAYFTPLLISLFLA